MGRRSAATPAVARGRALSVTAQACASCLRRAWLLAELSGPLHSCARDPERLLAVVALDDAELIAALGGRRRAQLVERLESSPPDLGAGAAAPFAVCRHGEAFPRSLRLHGRTAAADGYLATPDARAPAVLFADRPPPHLAAALAPPLVAIVGSRRCSAYGAQTARALGRGLAAAGVGVACTSEPGIAAWARAGAADLDGRTIVVEANGLGPGATPVDAGGATLTETPPGCAGRAFGAILAQRLLVALSSLVVVVEARASPLDLTAPRVALEWPRPLAAIPGRADSPTALGTHALLRRGVPLVCSAADVVALLGPTTPPSTVPSSARAKASGRPGGAARALLARVTEGEDSVDRLVAGGGEHASTLLALSELELAGLLARGPDGAYIPTAREQSASAQAAEELLAGLKPPARAADDE
jgi:DNA processing protein